MSDEVDKLESKDTQFYEYSFDDTGDLNKEEISFSTEKEGVDWISEFIWDVIKSDKSIYRGGRDSGKSESVYKYIKHQIEAKQISEDNPSKQHTPPFWANNYRNKRK